MPTGNPIAPVIELSTNRVLANRMPDIIDIDTRPIISGEATVHEIGEKIVKFVARIASGEVQTKPELNNQQDFILWKRVVSL